MSRSGVTCRTLTHVKLAVIYILAGTLFSALAQQDRGTIEGIVTDTSGAPLPNVAVQVANTETNQSTVYTTNLQGRYFAPNLPIGIYRVIVEKSGFQRAESSELILQAQASVRCDVTVQIGGINQSITVTSQAPLVDASSPTVSASLTNKTVTELPDISVGTKRDIANYLQYFPGYDRTAASNSSGGDYGPRVNGANGGDSEIFLDGAPASQMNDRGTALQNGPAIEQVAEFQIVTNSFNAEYGRTGSWFTNIVMRSGTNEVHGSAYDYFANSDLNARSFFSQTVPVIRQNEGGVTLGGPVYIPRLYNGHNRTFFFFGQQLFYNTQGATGNLLTIPAASFRTGNFSSFTGPTGAVIPIYDPNSTTATYSRTPFPGNIIPSSRLSPQSLAIVNLMPAPDLPGEANNYYNRTGNPPKLNTFVTTIKVDQNISSKQRLSVLYSWQDRPRIINGWGWGINSPLEGDQIQSVGAQTVRVNHDSIFSPSLVNHITLAADRFTNVSNAATVGQGWNQKLGITGVPYDNGAFPLVAFAGGTAAPDTMGMIAAGSFPNGRYDVNDSLTWVRGRHSLKFGGDYGREYTNYEECTTCMGEFIFTNTITASISTVSTSGSALASFLLGDVYEAEAKSLQSQALRWAYWAIFTQDQWRATSKLTVSYGFRWEGYPAQYDAGNQYAAFSPTAPNPGAGNLSGAVVYAGTGPGEIGRRNLADNYYGAVGPRLGFAYALTPKTIFRASGGVFYAPGAGTNYPAYGYILNANFTSADGVTPLYSWTASPFPQKFVAPPNRSATVQNGQAVNAIFPDSNNPAHVISWTADIQRQLTPNLLLDTVYIGSHSTHLDSGDYNNTAQLAQYNVLNPAYLSLGSLLTQSVTSAPAIAAGIALPYAGFTGTVGQALRPYPQYQNVSEIYGPRGIAHYDALQIKLTKRYSGGLTLLSYFTWSKNLTNTDASLADSGESDGPIQNPYNAHGEVSVSADTPPVSFGVSGSYELPFGSGKRFVSSGLLSHIVAGWMISGFDEIASGTPLAITASNSVLSALGYPNVRANLVLGQPIHLVSDPRDFDPATDRYLNPAAFTVPSTYQLGNTGRYLPYVRNWTQKYEQLAIGRTFMVSDKLRLRFRADATNPFNFVRWGAPNTNLSSAQFGMVTSAAPGRQMQLSLSLSF